MRWAPTASARAPAYEIDFRLKQKHDQFEQAIMLAHGLRMDAIADDGIVMANQPMHVTASVANRGPEDVTVKSRGAARLHGEPACPSAPIKNTPAFVCAGRREDPGGREADRPLLEPSAGRRTRHAMKRIRRTDYPFRPSPFRARFDFDVNGVFVSSEMPVQYRYAGDLATGEKRMELNVVPGLSLHVEPGVMIVPLKVAAGVDRRKEVRVTVENNTKGAATANVALKVPAGWRVMPASAPISLGAEGEIDDGAVHGHAARGAGALASSR